MISEYFDLVAQRQMNYPNERVGQSYMNALWFYDPEIHAKVHGTTNDCFYDDKRLANFLSVVFVEIQEKEREQPERGNWPQMTRAIWPDGEQV